MARRKEKNLALKLRKQGYSYSQINKELGISKSTLSGWLRDFPLSKQRVLELQKSDRVIEKIRNTKKQKRDARHQSVFRNASQKIGVISKREFFIAGLFLYWAEGGKTNQYSVSLSNTDPAMIRTFIKWLQGLQVPKEKMIVRLHLYVDMNISSEINYWQNEINLPIENFRKPYVKKSKLSDLTYITRGHGTCNIFVYDRDTAEFIHQSMRYLKELY